MSNREPRPKPSTHVFIRVDASFASTLVHTGVGGVVRDIQGEWIMRSGKNLRLSTAFSPSYGPFMRVYLLHPCIIMTKLSYFQIVLMQ